MTRILGAVQRCLCVCLEGAGFESHSPRQFCHDLGQLQPKGALDRELDCTTFGVVRIWQVAGAVEANAIQVATQLKSSLYELSAT